MKIAIFSTKDYEKKFFQECDASRERSFTFFTESLSIDTYELTQGFEGVCVFVNDTVNSEVIENLANNGIRLILLRCAGYDNVDLKAAQKHNITVARVPSYSPQSVIEHTLGLILCLNRKIHVANKQVRQNNFSLENLTGFCLAHKNIGVIGTGYIGGLFCKLMSNFGCNIFAYDIYESEELKKIGVQYITQDELFKKSDIISLHCPLFPEIQHIINKTSLSLMKDSVMIINTSRGELINTEDCIEALKNKKIGSLGIDVYENEKDMFFNDLSQEIQEDRVFKELLGFENVIVTPHQAFLTQESLFEIAQTTLENISDFVDGKKSENQVIV